MSERLEKFLASCNQDNAEDAATVYIKAGGNVLEILKSLNSSEKKSVYTVFSAMYSVVMKILANFPQKLSSAEEACRYLINSHLSSIHSMLSSQSAAKDRKIVLKLLAAVVSLGGTFPRELLNHLSLHQELVDALITHSKPTDQQSVRTCFIHFLLAFLPEGNAQDIRALLEKRGVFSSIFSGLIYDYPDLIQLVLTTTRQYILENPKITKTVKLHVFSTPVIQSIVQLYNWKGPNIWSNKEKKSISQDIDPIKKEFVVDAVHEFLIVLLTSNKHGIVFHDKSLGTDSSRKHNELINTILQSLEKPWEHSKPAELVVLILRACPDLIKAQYKYAEPYLQPRVSKNWFDVISFIDKVINNIDEENFLKLCSSEMTINSLMNAILNLITPAVVIKNAILPAIEHNNSLVRHGAISLLHTMIKKVLNFTRIFERSLNKLDFTNLSNFVSDYILKNMPSFESVLNVWSKAFHSQSLDQSEEESCDTQNLDLSFEIKDHLILILNLLQVYSAICPEILTAASVETMKNKPTILITNLFNLQNLKEDELIIIKVNALKILLHSNICGFSPNEELFNFAVSFLLTAYGNRSIDNGNKKTFNIEVHKTISLLLNSCGVFEGFSDEIDIWIEAFEFLEDFEKKLEVANWFVKIIKRAFKHTEKYVSLIHETEKNAEEEIMDVNRLEDILNDLSEKNVNDTKLLISSMPVTSISIPTYVAIESLEKNPVNIIGDYMSTVLAHILHFQVSTKAFITLTENLKISAQKYLLEWKSENISAISKKPFKYHELLINRNLTTIEKSEKSTYKVEVINETLILQQGHNIIKIKLTSLYVKALVRMILFHLLQLSQQKTINDQNIIIYKDILLSLLRVSQEMNSELVQDCAKWIFKHPVFLHYFQGFYKNNITEEKIITELFIEICTLFSNFGLQISPLLYPYQEKFITDIKLNIKKYDDKSLKNDEKMQVDEFQNFSKDSLNRSTGTKRKREQDDDVNNESLSSNNLKKKTKRQKNHVTVETTEDYTDAENAEKVHIELVPLLQMSPTNIRNIFSRFINLPEEAFLSNDKSTLSNWGIIIPELLKQLSSKKSKFETNSSNAIPGNLLKKLFFYLTKLKTSHNLVMDEWENSLHGYLLQFPNHISILDEKIFLELVKTNLTSASIKLLVLLVKGNHKFITAFKSYASNNEDVFEQKSLIFSILSHNLAYKWDNEFLEKLYALYKKEIFSFATEMKVDEFIWLKENIEAAAYLIDNQFDPKTCKDICNTILSNETKLELAEEQHIKLFIHLFYKSIEIDPDALKNLVKILLHTTVSTLKKSPNPKNISKLKLLNEKLILAVKDIKLKNNFIFEEINEKVRKLFIRISLQSGLKVTKNAEKNMSFLIKALAEICDLAFKDDGNEQYIKDIFDMTVSQADFMKIILSNLEVKDDLLKLLLILLKKNHTLMLTTRIPLYLASYNATLTTSDQIIFKILQLYESSGVKLDDYWPYLWGNAAASHYSVKSKIETALWRQPSTSQVLDLLVPEIVLNTIKYYPVHRNWKDEFLRTTNIEKEVYDPIFYLPLFSSLLSENNFVACHKVIHSGALALAIISLSSMSKNVRLRAITVISRFHFHLEATISKEKSLWINFLNVLRNGINETEQQIENIRLNGFVATFLARASLIMAQPGNPLYTPLHKFFMAKPALELDTIPELLQLFHSSEIEHVSHRHWILEVIRDGFKTDSDMEIALKCVIFKLLFTFYDCSLADNSSKNIILEIVRAVTNIPKPCSILSNKYSLIPWLNNIIHENLNKKNVDSIITLLGIVNNILTAPGEESKKKKYYFYSLLEKTKDSLQNRIEVLST